MVDLAYADAENAVKVWARAQTDLTTLVGHRTFLRLPDDYLPSVKGSALTLSLVGGAPDAYTPVDAAEILFSCWGATRANAGALRLALIRALHSLTRTTVQTASGDVILAGARVTSSFYRPDIAGDPIFPRYVVTAVVAVLPST